MKRIKILSIVTALCLIGSMVFGCSAAKKAKAEKKKLADSSETQVEEEESVTTKESGETKTTIEEVDITEETTETQNSGGISISEVTVNDYLSYSAYQSDEMYVCIPSIYEDDDSYKEINDIFRSFASFVLVDSMCGSCYFKACDTGDGIVSIFQIRYSVSDMVEMNVATFDLNSGKMLTNEEIMDYCGYTSDSLYEDATKSLKTILDNYFLSHEFDEEARENMFASGFGVEAYEMTFSTDSINSDMMMFISPEGKLLLCSTVFSLGSASLEYDVYDLNGNSYINHRRMIIDEDGYETFENLEFANIIVPGSETAFEINN